MNSEFKHRRRFFFYPFIAAAFIFGAGYIVMLLWNNILPSVIPAVGTLTYLKAIGLLILCRILFGGFKGRGGYGGNAYRGGPPWKQKMMNMNEEEREKFKNEWRERCGRK